MSESVNNRTVLTGLFGYPVGHSVSPQIHNAAYLNSGLDWVYLAFSIKPVSLRTAFAGFQVLGGRGLNITIPHKQEIMRILDKVSDEACLIGAVNTVLFRDEISLGYNTDGPGYVNAIMEEKSFSLEGKRICLIGAGGAGRAVAVQSALSGASRIAIADLNCKRAQELSDWVNQKIGLGLSMIFDTESRQGKKLLSEADLVVDATPLGLLSSDPMSFDPVLLSRKCLVMDLVYNPPETMLIKKSRELGIEAINGLGMLVHQAALSWEIWTGETASIAVMKDAARAAIYGVESKIP